MRPGTPPALSGGTSRQTRLSRPLKLAITAVAAVLLLALPGCAAPGKPGTSALRTYLLQPGPVPRPALVPAAENCVSLRVAMPTAAPGFATSRMAYTTEPPRLDYFAFHEWVDAPARMLATLIETGLDASGLFEAVVAGSADIRTDLRLDSELLALRQDFSGSSSAAALEVKLKLVDVSARSLLAAKTFSYSERADGANPEAGVSAANRAAARFLADLEGFMAAAIEPLDCAPR